MLRSSLLLASLFLCAAQASAQPKPAKALWQRGVGPAAGSVWLETALDTVLTVTWDAKLVALNAAGGKERWRRPLKRDNPYDGPSVALSSGVVVVSPDQSAQVLGLDSATGREIWRLVVDQPVQSVVACEGTDAVVLTHRGADASGQSTLLAHAISPKDGSSLWRTPVPGVVHASGAGHVFAGKQSDVGVHLSEISAIRCMDGRVHPLARPTDRKLTRFVDAEDGRVATLHFNFGAQAEQLCAQPLEGGQLSCFAIADVAPAPYPFSAGLLSGDTLFFSVNHREARNLDPSPDGWLVAFDLSKGQVTATSPDSVCSSGLADAGAALVCGFGTTGAADALFLLERATLKPLLKLPLKKAPERVAADAERAYVATYDGALAAIALPIPGKKRPPVVSVSPQPSASPAKLATTPAVVTVAQVLTGLHPPKAKTSGTDGVGALTALAFVGANADRLAVTGNDDRLRVVDVASGRTLWKSKPLGKDGEHVLTCPTSERVVVSTYGGVFYVFDRAGTLWRQVRRLEHGFGWLAGLDETGERLLADSFNDALTVYEPKSGAVIARVPGGVLQDKRGMVPRLGRLATLVDEESASVISLTTGEALSRVAVPVEEGRELVHLEPLAPDRVLTEHCDSQGCVVRWIATDGKAISLTFDIKGSVWVPSVPSTLVLSPDEGLLFFHRDGLEALVVRVADGQRQSLGRIPRTSSGVPQAAFSADGARLAVSLLPNPQAVTIFQR